MFFRPFTIISENPNAEAQWDAFQESVGEGEQGDVYPLPGVSHHFRCDTFCHGHADQHPYHVDFVPKNSVVQLEREKQLGQTLSHVTQILDEEARLRLRVLRPSSEHDLFIFERVNHVMAAPSDTFFKIRTRASVFAAAKIETASPLIFEFGSVVNLRAQRFVLGTWLDRPVLAFQTTGEAKRGDKSIARGARVLVSDSGELILLEDADGLSIISPHS